MKLLRVQSPNLQTFKEPMQVPIPNARLHRLAKNSDSGFQLIESKENCLNYFREILPVRHMTGTGSGLLGGIPRVVVQISALTLKGPL